MSIMASLSTLPPEIFEEIVEELYEIEKQNSSKLGALALVQKKFYLPVKRRMLKYLTCDFWTVGSTISLLHSNVSLRPLVLEIYVVCSMDVRENYREVTVEDFNQLVSLTPNLQVLRISESEALLSAEYLEDLGIFQELPILSHLSALKKLTLEFGERQFVGDPVTQFVNDINTPHLNQLDLYISSYTLANAGATEFTTSTFPLHSFTFIGYEEPTVHRLLQLPLSLFQDLTELTSSNVMDEWLKAVVQISGSTLKQLTLRGSLPYSYSFLLKLFPYLSVLQDLSVKKMDTTPQDFFAHIPSTIDTLKITFLQPIHFEYLLNHPRPELRIQSFVMGSVDASILTYLPTSVRKISLVDDERCTIEDILRAITSRTTPTFLNTIRYISDQIVTDLPSEGIEGLKKLGIKLEVSRYN